MLPLYSKNKTSWNMWICCCYVLVLLLFLLFYETPQICLLPNWFKWEDSKSRSSKDGLPLYFILQFSACLPVGSFKANEGKFYNTRHKSLKQKPFFLNFLGNFLNSIFTPLFSLKCTPLLPQWWATRILEYWDDFNTQINIREGEEHKSVSRFVTSIAEL